MTSQHLVRITLILLGFLWFGISHVSALANHAKTIRLTAVVQESPDQIQLNWLAEASYTITHQKIWRRTPGGTWGSEYTSLLPGDITYTDTNVVRGTRYEYRIVRLFSNGPRISTGYIETGIHIPEVDRRGSLILLVRDTAAAGLATELTQLQKDLAGDGWHIIREDITAAQSVPDVKAIITGHYNNPATPDITSVFIVGHVPVPYSGNIAPDGHTGGHEGAWPADVFYAEMNGIWTDTTVNSTTAPARNQNIPGDGKYDQSILPSAADLQIGRVDLNDMNIFPDAATTEIDLLRRYLTRNHNYRHVLGNYTSIPRRGLIDDNFGYFGGEAFASSAWWNFSAFFGPANITSADWFTTLNTNTYLWAFGAGAGSNTKASGVGNSAQFGTTDSKAVFCMMFGSIFGDWDNTNNFLRAPLANTEGGLALANMWAGRPQWHIHSMATGRTLGYGTRITQNNIGDYPTGHGGGMVHVALMGDPSLRLFPVIPVSGLGHTSSAGKVSLSWTASTDSDIQGYAIYRGPVGADTTGNFVRLNPSLAAGTSYNDLSGTPGMAYVYMVRAVKLETSASATYLNSSQGVFHNASPAAVTGPEISISGNSQPIQSGTTAALEANHTDFGSGEITLFTQSRTFTIRNDGTSDLTMSGTPSIVTLSGDHAADFTVTLQPATNPLASGANTTFDVSFTTSVVGLRTAVVHITSDDADEASFTFTITGTGEPNTPDIDVPLTSFSKTLAAGTSSTSIVVIDNNGLGNLNHTITSKYAHRDSNHVFGPSYQWTDISSVGTKITSWSGSSAPTDNGGSASIPIGFSFPFYDNSHSSLKVSTEGFITFGSWVDAPSPYPVLPSLGAPASMIAVYWDDLDLRSSYSEANQGSVYYHQTDSDTFIIQYEGVYQYNESPSLSDDRLSCQIVLKSSGEIQMHYKTVPTTTHYTVGMQNADYNDGITVAAYTAYLSDSMAVRILPPATTTGNWLTTTPAAGTINPSGTSNITLTFDAVTLPLGPYFGCLTITSNDPDSPTINVELELEVGTVPEIGLTGNNLTITHNSTTTQLANHTDFGERSTGDPTLVRTYTINNSGTAPLNLGVITITGADFTVTPALSSSIAVGVSTTFDVSFPMSSGPGTYNATVTVPSNDSNEASSSFAVSAVKLTMLESWRKSHFSSSANLGNGANGADPDADGLDNLLEYALEGNPTSNDATTVSPTGSQDASGRLQIQFNRYSAKTGLNYIVQASSNLSDWDDIATSTAGAATANTTALSVNETGSAPVVVTVTDSVLPLTRRFLRLKVEEN